MFNPSFPNPKCFILLCILILFAIPSSIEKPICDPIQFLITFHPHLDAFWLHTDTELKSISFIPQPFLFNLNQRNSKTIFNSMLQSLLGNSQRKYFITQVVFFKDWFQGLSLESQKSVINLLNTNQLEITNGGWVQNDQAVCYYLDIIDQYTLGMNYLYNHFQYQIKIGWATDSFGHSHSQAGIAHLLGLQFQSIERNDERFVNETQFLQYYWEIESDSNGNKYGGVVNNIRHFLHELNAIRTKNEKSILKADLKYVKNIMSKKYHTNTYFRFLGNDFEEFTPVQFQNLQQIMQELNQEKVQQQQQCSIVYKYGNPRDQVNRFEQFYANKINQIPVRKYDLIPNWDRQKYWSGYFTTNPSIKKKCKDYSRLLNFYRKSLLFLQQYQNHSASLNQFQELLAVMQHHDGITATSKQYVLEQMEKRLENQSHHILESVDEIHKSQNNVFCRFYQDNNECKVVENDGVPFRFLYVIMHGADKEQKISLILPHDIFYEISGEQSQIFCSFDEQCVVIFSAHLHAGINKFELNFKNKDQVKMFVLQQKYSQSIIGTNWALRIDEQYPNSFTYQFGNEFIKFGLFSAANQVRERQILQWDKFGQQFNTQQYVVPGIYIMFNDGKLDYKNFTFNSLKFAEGLYYKIFEISSQFSTIKLTIKNSAPHLVDMIHTFHPTSIQISDFFLRVSSTIKNSPLYHDSNGFLVAKRYLNSRPDYKVKISPDDFINANTYPACSFAYLMEGNKKLVFFSDRAQGVAFDEESMLINFDRNTLDDGKGIGEPYLKVERNTWRYKFGVVEATNDIERKWQRQYDEIILGYLSEDQIDLKDFGTHSFYPKQTTLSFSMFFLNEEEYVIRLQNLGEFQNISVPKWKAYGSNKIWEIEEIGLSVLFFSIGQSYANGIVKQSLSLKQNWRKYWQNDAQSSINIFNVLETDDQLILRPLEIRSFRINTHQKIKPNRPQPIKTIHHKSNTRHQSLRSYKI